MIERTPLPTTLESAFDYARKNGRIVPWAPYGQHIPLYCENHPDLRWSTKNISPIGARSILYDLMGESTIPECQCKLDSLRPLIPDNWQDKIIPMRILTCQYCGVETAEESCGNPNCCRECFDIVVHHGKRLRDIENELSGGDFWKGATRAIQQQAMTQLKKELSR